jgi:hypothetical protein
MEPPSLESSTSLELKGRLDYRMCPEWVLDMLKSTDSSNRSRVPEIESIEYWKAKSKPINIESAAQN